ncbi:HNH endonuclease [Rhodococcus pyridinivorans]|uniref:HNH endonuclease signature motif containing protein n=1 Tax=Rhodococcus pyridinivorans TaxID=103816 RepID=UPI001FFF2CB9|nr:HNH endonuclease signature motif containing protein [Rhodococcus pyridinivorans]UPK63144.1 HNH endonuclease [Rhodococcus pyridinivorans]
MTTNKNGPAFPPSRSRTEMSDRPAPESTDGADRTSSVVSIHGVTAPFADTAEQAYIADRVVYDPETHCWLWRLGLFTDGYGKARRDGRMHRAHRVAYEAFRGPIPAGLVLDHLCEVTVCCNPWHLEPVTNRENIRRGKRSDTATHCSRGHSWAEHERRDSRGRRQCRACKSEADRRRRRVGATPRRTDDTACRRGHELTAENVYVDPRDGVIVCRKCKRANDSRTHAARRAEALAYRTARFVVLGLDELGLPVTDDTDEEEAS